MSNHRICCQECCTEGYWIYAQPCEGSTAYLTTNPQGLNITHWERGCQPKLYCTYVNGLLKKEKRDIIPFAFLGACWFVDGTEPVHAGSQEPPDYAGFFLDSLDNEEHWHAEEVYETCEDCVNKNESWFRFTTCDCEETLPPDDGLGGVAFDDCVPGQICNPVTPAPFDTINCATECYTCTKAMRFIYVPTRYMEEFGATTCDSEFEGVEFPCGDPKDRCMFWKEALTVDTGETSGGCCMQSCNETQDAADIVSYIPCGLTTGSGQSTDCFCCNIWTPFHRHPFDADGSINCDAGLYNQGYMGERHRGCCACCAVQPYPPTPTSYCSMFEGITSITVTVDFDQSDSVGCTYGPALFDSNDFCCGFSKQCIQYEFNTYSDVAETGIWRFDPEMNVEGCIFMADPSSSQCQDWFGDDPGPNTTGRECLPDALGGCTKCYQEAIDGDGEIYNECEFRTICKSVADHGGTACMASNYYMCNPADGTGCIEGNYDTCKCGPTGNCSNFICGGPDGGGYPCCEGNTCGGCMCPEHCYGGEWGSPCCADIHSTTPCDGGIWMFRSCAPTGPGPFAHNAGNGFPRWWFGAESCYYDNGALGASQIHFTFAFSGGLTRCGTGGSGIGSTCCSGQNSEGSIGCTSACGQSACESSTDHGIAGGRYDFCFTLSDHKVWNPITRECVDGH